MIVAGKGLGMTKICRWKRLGKGYNFLLAVDGNERVFVDYENVMLVVAGKKYGELEW